MSSSRYGGSMAGSRVPRSSSYTSSTSSRASQERTGSSSSALTDKDQRKRERRENNADTLLRLANRSSSAINNVVLEFDAASSALRPLEATSSSSLTRDSTVKRTGSAGLRGTSSHSTSSSSMLRGNKVPPGSLARRTSSASSGAGAGTGTSTKGKEPTESRPARSTASSLSSLSRAKASGSRSTSSSLLRPTASSSASSSSSLPRRTASSSGSSSAVDTRNTRAGVVARSSSSSQSVTAASRQHVRQRLGGSASRSKLLEMEIHRPELPTHDAPETDIPTGSTPLELNATRSTSQDPRTSGGASAAVPHEVMDYALAEAIAASLEDQDEQYARQLAEEGDHHDGTLSADAQLAYALHLAELGRQRDGSGPVQRVPAEPSTSVSSEVEAAMRRERAERAAALSQHDDDDRPALIDPVERLAFLHRSGLAAQRMYEELHQDAVGIADGIPTNFAVEDPHDGVQYYNDLEDVVVAAPKEVVDDIPILTYEEYKANFLRDRDDTDNGNASPMSPSRLGISSHAVNCVVCLCDFENDEQVRLLSCEHIFHVKCLDSWLERSKKCPICKARVCE